MIARGFEGQLRRELHLSREQVAQIRAILDDGHAESERIRGELAPRIREHMERIHDRIMDVLTAEQRERFDELHERHRRRADAFLLGPEDSLPHGHPPASDHRPLRRSR
jgi:Spy/CpxP family protein refolding chaperone